MKAKFLYIKKTLAAGIGFAVVFLSTFDPADNSLIPEQYIKWVTLAVGLSATYTVWKLNNGPKPPSTSLEAPSQPV